MTDRIEKARQEKNRYKRRALEAEAEVERLRGLLEDAGVYYTGPSADAEFQAEKRAGLRDFFRTVTDRTPTVGDTITTAEELDALPNLTVLHDADQHVIERHGTIEHEGGASSAWLGTVPPTMCMGEEVDLPATVLHVPGQQAVTGDAEAEIDRLRDENAHLEAARYAAAQMAGTAGDRLGQARADRDRARRIATHLEQENAHLEATKNGMRILADARQVVIREQAAEIDRYRAEAHAAHSVIEQVGLLQEWLAAAGSVVAPRLQHILNGGTLDEVRQDIYDGAHDG